MHQALDWTGAVVCASETLVHSSVRDSGNSGPLLNVVWSSTANSGRPCAFINYVHSTQLESPSDLASTQTFQFALLLVNHLVLRVKNLSGFPGTFSFSTLVSTFHKPDSVARLRDD